MKKMCFFYKYFLFILFRFYQLGKLERKIRNLLKRQEDIDAATKEKKIQLWEINGHIKKVWLWKVANSKIFKKKSICFFQLEKEINTLQETQSTEQIYSEQLLKSRDDIKKLENQLEVVQKRCGEAMSENTNLRGSIDHLLLERYVLFKKLFPNTKFLWCKRRQREKESRFQWKHFNILSEKQSLFELMLNNLNEHLFFFINQFGNTIGLSAVGGRMNGAAVVVEAVVVEAAVVVVEVFESFGNLIGAKVKLSTKFG